MPERKSRLMITTERRFGKPIEELLPELYYDRNMPHQAVADRLRVSRGTVHKWWRYIRAHQQPAESVA